MPPRFTYWTIILEGKPTAFRAHTQDELAPTLRQLQTRHPDATLMWFARGRLWESPEQERAALRARRDAGRERRGPDWRPGGQHQDPRDRFKVPRDEKRRRFAQQLRRDRTEREPGVEGPPRPDRPQGPRSGRPEGPRGDRPQGPRTERPQGPRPERPRGPKALTDRDRPPAGRGRPGEGGGRPGERPWHGGRQGGGGGGTGGRARPGGTGPSGGPPRPGGGGRPGGSGRPRTGDRRGGGGRGGRGGGGSSR